VGIAVRINPIPTEYRIFIIVKVKNFESYLSLDEKYPIKKQQIPAKMNPEFNAIIDGIFGN
jgi:hypothetical protein